MMAHPTEKMAHPLRSRARQLLVLMGIIGGALTPTGAGAAALAHQLPLRPSAHIAATDWLGEINTYRVAAGLAPVVE